MRACEVADSCIVRVRRENEKKIRRTQERLCSWEMKLRKEKYSHTCIACHKMIVVP